MGRKPLAYMYRPRGLETLSVRRLAALAHFVRWSNQMEDSPVTFPPHRRRRNQEMNGNAFPAQRLSGEPRNSRRSSRTSQAQYGRVLGAWDGSPGPYPVVREGPCPLARTAVASIYTISVTRSGAISVRNQIGGEPQARARPTQRLRWCVPPVHGHRQLEHFVKGDKVEDVSDHGIWELMYFGRTTSDDKSAQAG